jgi:ABC-type transport system substrate-binding protein
MVSQQRLIGIVVAIIVLVGIVAFIAFMPRAPPQEVPRIVTPTTIVTSPTQMQVQTTPQQTVRITPATSKEELRVAIGTDLDTLDPHDQTTSLVDNVIMHVCDRLFDRDANGNLVPMLAIRLDVSSDGLTYTIYLRQGVKFHNGEILTADIVKLNFDRIFNASAKKRLSTYLPNIQSYRAVNDTVFEIKLSKPFAPFSMSLSLVYIVAKEAIERYGDVLSKDLRGLICTGPFRMVEWVKGTKVVLERFDGYWGGNVPLKRIIFYIVPEESTREAMLLAGDVDLVFWPSLASLTRLNQTQGIKVIQYPTYRYVMLHFNFDYPAFQDKRVRHALNYAIDKETIISKIFYGTATLVKGPWQIGLFGYKEMGYYKYDPQKARQLLEEAGYTLGPDGILVHPQYGKFSIKMVHMKGRFPGDVELAQAIQGYLRSIGIEVELVTGDWPWYINTIYSSPSDKAKNGYYLFQRSWGPSVPDPYYTVYFLYSCEMWVGPDKTQHKGINLTSAGRNIGYYCNRDFDNILRSYMVEVDQVKRLELANAMARLLWDDAPAVYLFQLNIFVAAKSNLEGLIFVPGELIYLAKAYFR